MLGGVHGENETKVYKDLCKAVEEWIVIYKEDGDIFPQPTAGKTFSGKFNIRVGKSLHEHLSLSALKAGESLNSYCVKQLKACP
jgi:predicted HicB family RNase H-like nuclease